MKSLSRFYMEFLWVRMGSLRNIGPLHKLFNVCYSVRLAEYKQQIMLLKQGVN